MKIELEEIREISRKAHEGQFRRDGVTPYYYHPLRVALMVDTDEEKAVALLHDVLEDSDYTIDELLELRVPKEIVVAVDVITKRDGESYETYLKRVYINDLAKKVKIADMHQNLSDGPTYKQIKKYSKGLDFLRDGAKPGDEKWTPIPDTMWLVGVECQYNVIRVSPNGKGFFIPGQEPCWHFDHVDKWIREIKLED